ncbi:uncharacterized protein LOC110732070 [Chenopodium quinoa]|uniref:uncharacterized protein LOC110732070 n=1 Tax=Chenopodium quinoa TaxID=63459 RepID=UPI000B78C21C|nr:uncharacterized protein LOC110732070 [Chenopodium quinoa]
MNACILAEYLAERYGEEWRSNPTWKIKTFRARVLSDLGIHIGYSLAWLERAREKFMNYGSATEQYAIIWDYGKAMIKYYLGSGVYVVVEGVDRTEPPLFMRMYMCLAALKNGFNKGCRPLIGLDGCHLKGAYPGKIIISFAKDGNNQIFPFAWATMEVENKDTWCWFIQGLQKDIGDCSKGLGLTFMSDRQKGLLEAFDELVPNPKKRFCELFWNAARASTLSVCLALFNFDFEVAMESIKFLSEYEYEYLANISPSHWSRHAFSDWCKSNMLLNNLCKTFNAVIKDARDKPILTQMEWMRCYMMKRNYKKWEAVQKMEGKNMPYVSKVFGRIERAARYCIVQLSRGDSYEVELNGYKVVVDLKMNSCSCYHWQLTGIPCVHAYACILDKRVDPDDYVDAYYSRATYILAYQDAINPMSGPKHWEKIDLRQPLPPAVRSCGSTPKIEAPAASEPKVSSKPVLNTPWLQEQRRKKAQRAATNLLLDLPVLNKTFTQEQQKQQGQSSQPVTCSQNTQASTTAPATRSKAKGKNKVG